MSADPFGLAGRVVVVTGGRSGIGAAVARRLLQDGAKVGVLDVSPVPAGEDPQRLDLVCDVRSEASVTEAVAAVRERFGRIDGLVQSAGITRDGVLWKLDEAAWRDVLDVNLTGAFHVLKAIAPVMREQGAGAVVNVTSINGFRGKFGQSNYAASKAGLVAFTKTAARELGGFGVRVNAVAPGMVRTAMVAALPEKFIEAAAQESALKRVSEPDDVADAVLFLLSDRARQITGTTLRVDAGQCM